MLRYSSFKYQKCFNSSGILLYYTCKCRELPIVIAVFVDLIVIFRDILLGFGKLLTDDLPDLADALDNPRLGIGEALSREDMLVFGTFRLTDGLREETCLKKT